MVNPSKIDRNQENLNTFFLEGIRENNSAVIEQIFDRFRPGIRQHIQRNSGSREDADDIFMDALEVIFRKVKTNSLELNCAFYTYLFEICKRLWLKKIRKKKLKNEVRIETWQASTMGEEPVIEMEKTERYGLYREKFELLQEDCRKILDLHLIQNRPMVEIARMMGHKSAGYTYKRKHICKERLKDMIRADQRFEELKP